MAIVTGAGSGLGAAIATRLAGEGASVVCVDLTNAAAGTAEGLGDRGRAVQVDVADGDDVARLVGACPRTVATNSCTRRDLPTPAGPSTTVRRPRRSPTARSRPPASRPSSRPRLTIGASRWRACPAASGRTPRSRKPATGSPLPFRANGATGSTVTASRTSCQVRSPMRTSPGAGARSRRAAPFTASPTTTSWPPTAPTTTSPVFTPVRSASRTPSAASSSAFSPSRAWPSSPTARTARRASPSCSRGMP
jgi:hypothetical protein